MAKYIKCEVSRGPYSEVYIEVPDDFDVWDMRDKIDAEVQRIAEETLDDDWFCEEKIKPTRVCEVSEEEAKRYTYGVLKPKE